MTVSPRIFCVGMNYAAHVKELSDKIPSEPVFFMKPASCLVQAGESIRFPRHGRNLHHEAEVVVRIGPDGRSVEGVTLGLDLTLRDLQEHLRKEGLPWEICKSFDQSAPIGTFVKNLNVLSDLPFSCAVNGKLRQDGTTKDMIFTIPDIVEHLRRVWTLREGDLIYTGTPPGVGPLRPGDRVEISSPSIGTFSWTVTE